MEITGGFSDCGLIGVMVESAMPYAIFKNIKGDISGGISAAVIALPLALAFGVSAFASIGTAEAMARGLSRRLRLVSAELPAIESM